MASLPGGGVSLEGGISLASTTTKKKGPKEKEPKPPKDKPPKDKPPKKAKGETLSAKELRVKIRALN
jgi:hypothetical protein